MDAKAALSVTKKKTNHANPSVGLPLPFLSVDMGNFTNIERGALTTVGSGRQGIF
jgi:hypothetical protein